MSRAFCWAGACFLALGLALQVHAADAEFIWRQPQAKVLPNGDLEWAPKPFVFVKGASVRYIDFEGGSDDSDGLTTATAWKRHPSDPAAAGKAKADAGADTYVFKRGVVYRGALKGRLVGAPDKPMRLTSDPSWGQGEAVICGSELVANWRPGAGLAGMPESEKVWAADLPFSPRCLWLVSEGVATRIPLARTPNWKVSDPDDVMSEWFVWEQPEWWTDKWKTKGPGGNVMHLGVDKKNLTGKAEDYVGGLVWSEWGIVMGTPFASRVEKFDAEKRGIGFQGFWYGDSGKIITNNRYFLEDKPNYLDSPGEFWFEKKGDGGTLYVRLPDDGDPRQARIEAASRVNLMDFTEVRHARISGLTFRFSNVHWDLTLRFFGHPDVESAAIRLVGSGEDIQIANCRFENVNKAVRIFGPENGRLDRIAVADNDIRFTDHGAIEIMSANNGFQKKDPPFAFVGDIRVLRNRLSEIGHRPWRSDSAHALVVAGTEELTAAGNIIDRCYGAGVFLFPGRTWDERRDFPFNRAFVFHNKVTYALLAANDWGGIETWQCGPTYVYNNVSGRPGGLWNWMHNPNNKKGESRLGYAYYTDHGMKNYHFNNIAWGVNNDLGSKYCDRAAFYTAGPTILNHLFNNTAHRFAEGISWSPVGGRQFYLGNVFDDISLSVFNFGKQKEDKGAKYDKYQYDSIAISRNILHKTPKEVGFIEGADVKPVDLAGLRQSAADKRTLVSDIGAEATASPLRDPANRDFRPAPGSIATGNGVRFFVPWGLARVVGEWHFCRGVNPASVLDEHLYMYHGSPEVGKIHALPRHHLEAVNVIADCYEDGWLEDWVPGALRLNGKDRFLRLKPTVRVETEKWIEEFGQLTAPARAAGGKEISVEVRLAQLPGGQSLDGKQLVLHVHWFAKGGAWKGFLAMGTPFQGHRIAGPGPYSFKIALPAADPTLAEYELLAAVSPDGKWENNLRLGRVRIPVAPTDGAAKAFALTQADQPPVVLPPTPHDVDGNFLVEVVCRPESGTRDMVVVSDTADRGYELGLDGDGRPSFLVKADGEARAVAAKPVNDGRWHHLIAEADRTAGKLRLYVDGKLAGEADAAFQGACRNDAELLVGRSADGRFFAGSLDFLRIGLGSLADAKTNIEELYAWQFDGPFLRDFAGVKPSGRRDAGALHGAAPGK